MRIILFTGKGGVGKTTAAAGAAALSAEQGRRTLVLSTDAAHSLADVLGHRVGPEPTPIAPNLAAQQIDAQARFERSWAEVQKYLLAVLDAAGVDRITAEELTVIPGAEEVLALLEVRQQAVSGRWDTVVVDCAPTAETLRLLALPEALSWYMDRVFPAERRLVKALRPVLVKATGVPMPEDSVFDALERLHHDLEQVHALLTGSDASVRLVLTPESMVVAEARRAFTSLSLFGYRVDGVIANRVFPAEGADPWRARWVAAQADVLDEVSQSFGDLPVWRSRYLAEEPLGPRALADLAREVYGGEDLAVPVGRSPLGVRRTDDGAELRLALPFAQRGDVDLARHGEELVVTVAGYRRLLTLPTWLARMRVAGAAVEGGSLQVRFADEPVEAGAPSGGGAAGAAGAAGASSEGRSA